MKIQFNSNRRSSLIIKVKLMDLSELCLTESKKDSRSMMTFKPPREILKTETQRFTLSIEISTQLERAMSNLEGRMNSFHMISAKVMMSERDSSRISTSRRMI